MRFTSVEIAEDLYRRVKHYVADTDMSMKDIINQALLEYLTRHEKGGGKK